MDDKIAEIVADFIEHARGIYPTPEEAANALVRRLEREGYEITKKQTEPT